MLPEGMVQCARLIGDDCETNVRLHQIESRIAAAAPLFGSLGRSVRQIKIERQFVPLML